jgi:hypothetical protein
VLQNDSVTPPDAAPTETITAWNMWVGSTAGNHQVKRPKINKKRSDWMLNVSTNDIS